MPCFTFDSAHDLGVCVPPNRRVRGSFDPELEGPGDYTIRLHCADTSQIIAQTVAQSRDGAAVSIDVPHNHSHPGQGAVFQCAIRCQFDDGPVGVPVPKCLRNG
jgi:hypothetical protein